MLRIRRSSSRACAIRSLVAASILTQRGFSRSSPERYSSAITALAASTGLPRVFAGDANAQADWLIAPMSLSWYMPHTPAGRYGVFRDAGRVAQAVRHKASRGIVRGARIEAIQMWNQHKHENGGGSGQGCSR